MAERAPSKRSETFLALGIFILSIVYRVLLLQDGGCPPGPDVGLHNSIIDSIIIKNGNFSWNYYHMGGEPTLEHPGFHIFTIYLYLITGMPSYVAQYITAILFSSTIALCAFLSAKRVWNSPTASLIAAFLAVFSRFDIEMISWGGYPNVVALSIISLIFYIIFREDLSWRISLVISSLLTGSLIITHSLSTVTFACIAIPFLAFSFVISKRFSIRGRAHIVLASSMAIGALIVSPFIIHIFPIYVENIREGVYTGAVSENQRAILLTRVVPLQFVFLALVPSLSFLVFAKRLKGAFLSEAGVLFSLWLFIPILLTQLFRIGLYTDYFRFVHFLIFPLTIFFALLTDYSCSFLSEVVAAFTHVKGLSIDRKKITSLFVAAALIFYTFGFVPFFLNPQSGFETAAYYRVVYPQEFNSIEWIKDKTSPNDFFISNHGYGWWISGFGQRPTFTSTDPQFLTVSCEFYASYVARTLLKTNFVLNNGLIEIAEDGGYVDRYNPMVSVNCTKFSEPYPIFHFNESDIIIFNEVNGSSEMVVATTIPLKRLDLEENHDNACITIIRENAQLRMSRRVEITENTRYAVFFICIESLSSNISLQRVRVLLRAQGIIFQQERTVGFLDESTGVLAQLIFEGQQPLTRIFNAGKINYVELFYGASDSRKIEVKIIVGGLEVNRCGRDYIQSLLANMTRSWWNKEETDMHIKIFDYREIIRSNGIDFIAIQRDKYAVERFMKDPMFSLVYINNRVAIFKVQRING